MAGRWVKLYEKTEDWQWYKDGNTARVFFHLLIKTNYKNTTWKSLTVKRGQLVTSLPSIAKALGISVQNVRTALDHLVSTGEISQEITNSYRLVTVNNWGIYQGEESEKTDEVTDDQQANQQANHKRINRPKRQHKAEKQANATNESTGKSTDELTADIEYIESITHIPPIVPHKNTDTENEEPAVPRQDPIHEEIFSWLGGVPPMAVADIADLRASPGIDDELIQEAIKSTKARGIRSWEYALKVIQSAISRGWTTGKQYRAAKEGKPNGRRSEADERHIRSPGQRRTGAYIEKPGVDWDAIMPEA